jgi:hypothetical protein
VWDSIKSNFSAVGSFFKETFSNGKKAVKEAFGGLGTFFGATKDEMIKAFESIPDALAEIFRKALKKIKEIAGEIGDTVSGVVDKIPGVNLVKKGISGFKGLFANGGTLNRNGETAIVGDAGPELLRLLNGKAVVTPLNNVQANTPQSAQTAPQRTTVHQTYNIYVKEFATAQDARKTSQELAQLQRQTDYGKGLVTV